MKALIASGNSFIGSRLARRLLASGVDVSLLVREPGKLKAGLSAGCRVLKGDLADKTTLPHIPDDIGAVFHLASYVHKVPGTDEERKYVFAVNVEGTKNLLEGLPLSVGQIVYFSSVSVYGVDEGEGINETFVEAPATPYGQSKLEAENLISGCRKKGCPVSVIAASRCLRTRLQGQYAENDQGH